MASRHVSVHPAGYGDSRSTYTLRLEDGNTSPELFDEPTGAWTRFPLGVTIFGCTVVPHLRVEGARQASTERAMRAGLLGTALKMGVRKHSAARSLTGNGDNLLPSSFEIWELRV